MAIQHGIGFFINAPNAGDKQAVLDRLAAIKNLIQGQLPDLDADGSVATYNRWVLKDVQPDTEIGVWVGVPGDIPASIKTEILEAVNAMPAGASIDWATAISASDEAACRARMIQDITQTITYYWVFGLNDSMGGSVEGQFVTA